MARAQERVPGVEARAGKFPGPSLIPALQAIQERVGWLPREELVTLSREVRRPLYEIEGLISFYPHFRTRPPVKVEVHACHDLSCWLQGADRRIAELRDRYSRDADVEVTEVSCIGRCDVAPAVAVNEIAERRRGRPARLGGGSVGREQRGFRDGRRAGQPRGASSRQAAPWPNDPYARGRGTVPGAARGAVRGTGRRAGHRRAEGRGAARHGRGRLPHGP